MANSPTQISGMPYVPGLAHGFLHHGLTGAAANNIVLLSQCDIGPFVNRPAGFLVVDGAPLSHAMISLLGAGVPTVMICEQQAVSLEAGCEVWLDGATGRISTDIMASAVSKSVPPATPAGQPVLTADGVPVCLRASVRSDASARQAVAAGAESIGLVRSEYLLPEAAVLPDVKFYQSTFNRLCEAAAPLSVTVRLLDLAADKMPGWMPSDTAAGGVLGLQGARLFRDEPVKNVFHAQLTALGALSERFDIRLIIPYLSSYEELRYWIDDIRQHLAKPLPIGAMAESPAGALGIANWLEIADFVSVGCNDLMQCLFAADRDRPELSNYLDPYSPALYRFLRQVADGAESGLQRTQLCGVLPQLRGVLPILLGLGYRAFSVDVAHIPYLVQDIRATAIADAQSLAAGVCAAKESRQVTEKLGFDSGAGLP